MLGAASARLPRNRPPLVIGSLRAPLFLLALLPLVALPSARRGESVHEQAQALIAGARWDEAARLLQEHLERTADDPRALELYGLTLNQLGRRDEAAHYLDSAAQQYGAAGDERGVKNARRELVRVDKLCTRRDRMLSDIAAKLFAAARQLQENGHLERALDILERIEPIATGKDAKQIEELLATVRAAFEEVDLDEAAAERTEGDAWPLITLESEHYEFECNLEPEVVQLVADTLDDIHAYYVQIYFDGDEKAARSPKATIRVHPSKESMLGDWSGGTAPEGWWSPGENRVTCYDTRTTTGSLDWMLTTLFHEASHQFMTLLSRKGGWAPSWLNEGTASFFEGAVAMADHRVLWPDAALPRLMNLASMLESSSGPDARQVVSYSSPGSYPGDHYPFGWGLVYFLQQYEDPATLEYVYRPLYAQYRETITTKGGESMALFEEVFLGKPSPLGHASFDDFERDWKAWILEQVRPLHAGDDAKRRELRLALVERYLAAAALAAQDRKAKVGEPELLLRALGNVEYVRTRIDGDERPDLDVHLLQADLLERLGRGASAAPLIERVLDLADQGIFVLEEARYEALNERLKKLDSRNHALRSARSRVRGLSKSAARIVADYQEGDEPMLLRAYTFAALAGEALDDSEGLLAMAAVLRDQARAAGLLLGQVRPLGTSNKGWVTVFQTEAKRLEIEAESVRIESVRPVGYVNTGFRVGSEYELRARIHRVGAPFMSSVYGLVIAGDEDHEWYVFGIGDGKAGLWHAQRSFGGGAVVKSYETVYLDPPLADDEAPEVVIHVREHRKLEVRVGAREPFELELPDDYSGGRHVGIYVKDGSMRLESPVVELYP